MRHSADVISVLRKVPAKARFDNRSRLIYVVTINCFLSIFTKRMGDGALISIRAMIVITTTST